MTINASDLPLATRKRLGIETSSRQRPRTTQLVGPHNPDDRSTWRCHECGAAASVWAAVERHAVSELHHRIDLVLHLNPKGSHAREARPTRP